MGERTYIFSQRVGSLHVENRRAKHRQVEHASSAYQLREKQTETKIVNLG